MQQGICYLGLLVLTISVRWLTEYWDTKKQFNENAGLCPPDPSLRMKQVFEN